MQSLRVRLLGDLQVEGCDPGALGRRQLRTLLKILALRHGHPVALDHLVDCLWGDQPPTRPSDQISVLVSRLRGVLGTDRLERTDSGYRLRLDWLDVDALADCAVEAERRLGQGALAAARTAAAGGLALLHGPLLADEADPWWASAERAATDAAVLRLRHTVLAVSVEAADWPQAELQARALLGGDPFDETALRSLMRALSRTGRAASALAAYAAFRQQLSEELGVSPESDTEDLHGAILAGPAPDADAPPLPAARTPTVLPGRDDVLERLDQLVADAEAGRGALCLVEGDAGMGKTRVLRTWVESLAPRPVAVAFATCDELGHDLPLQPLLSGLDALARHPGAGGYEAVIGPDEYVLGPLLGTHGMTTAPAQLAALADPGAGQALLFGAVGAVIQRVAARQAVVLVLDDLHLADTATLRWLSQAAARLAATPVLLVGSTRPEEGVRVAGVSTTITLGPLDRDAAVSIVGSERADQLLERSGGNALFFTELAALGDTGSGDGADLPDSIRDTVEARCTRSGPAATTLRAAAVIGPEVDLDLLAAVTGSAPAELLDHLEEGVRRRFLVESGAQFAFTHALVREALAAAVDAARTAYMHRQAARALAARPDADPLAAARHARLGGEAAEASTMLVVAAQTAVARFDPTEARRLLDEAVALHDSAAARVERARVLTMVGRHDDAAADLAAARDLGAGPEVLEAQAWSSHFQRRLGEALVLADQGARDATTDELRTSCLSLGGWVSLARGDLDGAETRLESARLSAREGDELLADSWLAWLRMSQGRPKEAVSLVHLGDGRGLAAYRYPSAYALMAATMAHAMLGRPDQALATLGLLETAVQRMEAQRWIPRPRNLHGWIARNLGDAARADDLNTEAIEVARAQGLAEPLANGLLDLAAGRLLADDPAGALPLLREAERLESLEHTFRWRHRLRRRLLQTRLDLATSDADAAAEAADAIAVEAASLGTPRHEVQARLLEATARQRAGQPLDRADVDALLGRLDELAGLESWWITADVARCFDEPRWQALAARRVADLVAVAGPFAESLRRAADGLLGDD